MENLDLFYRTFEAYKKEISADPESAKFCRISKRQSDIENESLNIIFSTVDIDESWVNAIEKGLPYIEKAIKEDRQFIRSDGDIVPIEKVRKITKSSIEDLSKHSNYITHESDNEDIPVIPDKIFVLNKESDYAIYENKVLYATLVYLKDFVSNRINKIKEMARTVEFNSKLVKKIEVSNRKINLALNIEEKRTNDPTLAHKDAQKDIIDRLDDIMRNVMGLLKYPLMIEVSKTDMVSRPITKTNVLRMNTNFRESLALFDYIAEYTEDGFVVTPHVKSFTPFSDSISESLNDLMMTYSFLSYIYANELEPELKRRKSEYEAKIKAQNERALLERLRTLRIKASDKDETLLEYVTLFEQGYRILERKCDELDEKLEEEVQNRIRLLEEQKAEYEEKIVRIHEEHDNEIVALNEKHDNEIQEQRKSYQLRLEEKEKEHEEKVQNLLNSHNEEISNLRKHFEDEKTSYINKTNEQLSEKDAIISTKNNEINEKNQEISSLNGNINSLNEIIKTLNATLISLKEINGEDNDFMEYLEEASFDELEKMKNSFDAFYKKTWKEAKKKILKDNIKIQKKKEKVNEKETKE